MVSLSMTRGPCSVTTFTPSPVLLRSLHSSGSPVLKYKISALVKISERISIFPTLLFPESVSTETRLSEAPVIVHLMMLPFFRTMVSAWHAPQHARRIRAMTRVFIEILCLDRRATAWTGKGVRSLLCVNPPGILPLSRDQYKDIGD